MRFLKDLVNKKESAWPDILAAISRSNRKIEVLPVIDANGEKALFDTQVTTRSPMGSIIFNSGGLLIDSGWIRFLGSGCPQMERSLPSWNTTIGNAFPPKGFVLFADDAVGGFFAVDGGIFKKPGNVFWCPPDELGWEDTTLSYTDFLYFCIEGPLDEFAKNYRWTGWKSEVEKLSGDQGIFIYPPLFAQGPELGKRERIVAPISEVYQANVIALGHAPGGAAK